MKLNEFKSLSPYPFIFESDQYPSKELEQNKSCIKCRERECFAQKAKEIVSFKCNNGLWSFLIETNDQSIFIINGLILENDANSQIVKYKGKYIVSKKEIDRFVESIQQFEKIIEDRIIKKIEENFSVFHDIKTTATTVTNCAEKLIGKNSGGYFEEKLANSE